MRSLKDGADEHGELLAALGTLPQATVRRAAGRSGAIAVASLEEVGAAGVATMEAHGATWPAQLLN